MAYQIYIYTEAGVKVAILENATIGVRDEKMNQAPSLSFSLPADDAKAVFLTSAYEVKVWNTIKEREEGLYDIDYVTESWDGTQSIATATCSGVMAQLDREDNITYDSGGTPLTPTQIVTALLALQERTPAIAVGTIEPTTPFCLNVENTNLLEALLKCATDYLGGFMEVDENRLFNWWNDPAGDPVREIRYRKNLEGMTRTRDFTQIINKLYAYGHGEGDVQVTLVDAGEAYEYIEDLVSQAGDGTAENPGYGVSIKRITDGRITHPSTLLAWAQRILGIYKDPIYTYTVDTVNLAEHPLFTFDLEELAIGQIVRVVNPDLNDLNVDVRIVALTVNLSEPQAIQVELASATQDLSHLLGGVQSYQSLAQNMAVQIGAGQVTVMGTFTVDGWRTAGTTEIDGGNISTHSLSADAIKTSTLNAETITLGDTGGDSIIKSSNYVADTSGWQIKANGDAEFNNVKVRGTFYTCTLDTGQLMTVKGIIQSDLYVLHTSGFQLNESSAYFTNLYTEDMYAPYVLIVKTTDWTVWGHLETPDGDALYWYDKDGHPHLIVAA